MQHKRLCKLQHIEREERKKEKQIVEVQTMQTNEHTYSALSTIAGKTLNVLLSGI